MNNNAPILSVVIPVYNVKDYIENCVHSFQSAKFKNYEIILVDDGSKDGSDLLCDKLALMDNKVRVVHIENSGPSIARNVGIKNALGEYVFFCDSDDFVDPEAFSSVMDKIEKQKADLYVLSACHESSEPDVYFTDDVGLSTGFTSDLSEVQLYTLRVRLSAPWKKFFKRSLIVANGIEFPSGRTLHEDLSFFLTYLKYVENVCVLNDVMYFHRYAPNSLSRKISFNQFSDLVHIFEEMRTLVEEKGLDKKILNDSQTRLIAILMGMIVRMKKAGISDDNIAINLKDKDVDILVHGFVPQDAKSWIRMIAYKTRLFKLYSLLYR